VLCVTGGIAAYKAAHLCSLLLKAGANLRVAMSASAEAFVAPLTFEALTQHPVYTSVLGAASSYEMEHISWARWADCLVVAPASANTIARLAHGMADDAVSTLALSFMGPVFVAPAMNTTMLQHPATQENLETLRSRGVEILASESGALACGEVGEGRLAEPENIVAALEQFPWRNAANRFQPQLSSALAAPAARQIRSAPPLPPEMRLDGKTVLITSGPTREYLDPVRFLANPSSGRMGAALAREAARRGATVHLVSGPVHGEQLPADAATIHRVITAEEMLRIVQELEQQVDLFIFAAAVSDFRVAQPVHQKIKRTGNSISLPLIENPDISQVIGFAKRPNQVTIGFAAETNDLEANATAKLERKNLDAIVANNVADPQIGFGSDQNEATIYFRNAEPKKVARSSKDEVAAAILDAVTPLLKVAQASSL